MTAKEAKILAENNRDTLVDSEFNRIIELITEACNEGHLGITVKINKVTDYFVSKKLIKLGYKVNSESYSNSIYSIFWSNES